MPDKYEIFPLWGILFIIITYLIMPPIYYLLRQNKFTLKDYYILSFMIVFLTIGGYQLYFYPQNYHKDTNNIIQIPEIIIDKYIPKISWTVYIYNFIYYIGFGAILIFIKSYKEFVHICFKGLLLLSSLVLFFMVFPSTLPGHTRSARETNPMMKLAQSYDKLTNAFPSAHVAISVFIAFHLSKHIGRYAYIFPFFIFLTCLTTKQHYCIDCTGGAIWGYIYSLFML